MSADRRWTAIVPVKDFRAAKSRLRAAEVPSDLLARAFLEDLLGVLSTSSTITEVLVATHDAAVEDVAAAAGATTVDDRAHPGINAAAAHAASLRRPGTGVAVFVSDLPCLTGSAVAQVLDLACAHRTSFVADADGTGTSVWLSPEGAGLPSHFGSASRQAHIAAGAVDLVQAHPDAAPLLLSARLDVDTAPALERAVAHGVGPRSAALLST